MFRDQDGLNLDFIITTNLSSSSLYWNRLWNHKLFIYKWIFLWSQTSSLIPLCLLFLWLLRPVWHSDTCSQSQHYFLCVFVNLISCLTNMIEKCIDGDKLNIIFFYKTNNSCAQFKRGGSLANTVTTFQELFVWVASFARELILSLSAILYVYVGH